MNKAARAISIATDKVRAGSEENVVRYILAISLTTTMTVQSLIWISAASL